MKKRQWSIHHSTIEVPDAQHRWDQVYQLLLQWSRPSLPISSQEVRQQENDDEYCNLRPRFKRLDKHRHRLSNSNSTACGTIMKRKDGHGKRNISFAMMATAEQSSAGQGLIDFGSKWGVRHLIACSSQPLIDLRETMYIKCSSLKNLNEADVRWSLW